MSNGNLSEAHAKIDAIAAFHQDIINELFEDPTEINEHVAALIASIREGLEKQDISYGEGYDYIVHHGELIPPASLLLTLVKKYLPFGRIRANW